MAEDANDQNTNSNYVYLASFILALIGYGDASTLSSAASYAIQSHLNAFDTLDYAFAEYKNLDGNPELGSIPTVIPLERFYYGGEYMSDWYPCDAPYEAD